MTLRRQHVSFAVWCVAVLAAGAPVLARLWSFSSQDETSSYVVLVPLVTMALVFLERRRIFAAAEGGGGRMALAIGLCAATLGLVAAGPWGESAGLTQAVAALVLLLVAGFAGAYGPASTRAARFPLAFLLFTAPIPQPFLDRAIVFLQQWSAEATDWLFTAAGTTFYREGYRFVLPGLTIRVAEECSGIRSSVGLLLATLLVARMQLRTTGARAALVLAVVPVTVIKNAVRITVLSLLSSHVDPGFMHGWLHRSGGIVFLGLAFLMLLPVLLALKRLEQRWSGGALPAERAVYSV